MIAIITAMDVELENILARMDQPQQVHRPGLFGYTGTLSGKTAQEVWDLTCQKLAQPEMGVRGLISMSNVAFVGTTDDPIDTLEWHEKLA